MPKEIFLTTSIFSDKMLEMDMHLMHVESIETFYDLRNHYGTEIRWEKQFTLKKANLVLRTKRVPTYEGS